MKQDCGEQRSGYYGTATLRASFRDIDARYSWAYFQFWKTHYSPGHHIWAILSWLHCVTMQIRFCEQFYHRYPTTNQILKICQVYKYWPTVALMIQNLILNLTFSVRQNNACIHLQWQENIPIENKACVWHLWIERFSFHVLVWIISSYVDMIKDNYISNKC